MSCWKVGQKLQLALYVYFNYTAPIESQVCLIWASLILKRKNWDKSLTMLYFHIKIYMISAFICVGLWASAVPSIV